MKLSRYALVLLSLVLCAAVANAAEPLDFPPLFGTTPDNAVKSWIKYVVLGPRNSPLPIVLISPERFKTSAYPKETLIVLRHSKYDALASLTQFRTERPDCAGTKRKFAAWYTVEISQHADGKTQKCVLRQKSACRYLSGVVRLSGLDWTAEERRPIAGFMRSINCKSA